MFSFSYMLNENEETMIYSEDNLVNELLDNTLVDRMEMEDVKGVPNVLTVSEDVGDALIVNENRPSRCLNKISFVSPILASPFGTLGNGSGPPESSPMLPLSLLDRIRLSSFSCKFSPARSPTESVGDMEGRLFLAYLENKGKEEVDSGEPVRTFESVDSREGNREVDGDGVAMANDQSAATGLIGPVAAEMSMVTLSRQVPRSLLERFLLDEKQGSVYVHGTGQIELRADGENLRMSGPSSLVRGHATHDWTISDANSQENIETRVSPDVSRKRDGLSQCTRDALDRGRVAPRSSSVLHLGLDDDQTEKRSFVRKVHSNGGSCDEMGEEMDGPFRVSNLSARAPEIRTKIFVSNVHINGGSCVERVEGGRRIITCLKFVSEDIKNMQCGFLSTSTSW